MTTSRRTWTIALAAFLLGGLLGGGVGHALGSHEPGPIAYHADDAIAPEPLAAERTFQAYGRFTLTGEVIRLLPPGRYGLHGVIVVPENAEYEPQNYEVHATSGLHLVHIRNRRIPFAAIHLSADQLPADLAVGDRVAWAGRYGEIQTAGGSTTSLPALGLFVARIDER